MIATSSPEIEHQNLKSNGNVKDYLIFLDKIAEQLQYR
jgi:hypothetical protein